MKTNNINNSQLIFDFIEAKIKEEKKYRDEETKSDILTIATIIVFCGVIICGVYKIMATIGCNNWGY